MAIEQPDNPNTGGTGIEGSKYTEVQAPQFVGGQTDPGTGSIISSNSNAATQAPAPVAAAPSGQPSSQPSSDAPTIPTPQAPTTSLGALDANTPTPSLTQELAPLAAGAGTVGGAALGVGLAAGKTLGGAAAGIPSELGLSGITNALGITTAAPVATAGGAFSNTAAPVPFLAADGTTDLTATAGATPVAAAATGGAVDTILGAGTAGLAAGIGTAVTGALEGEQPKQYIVPAVESAGGAAVGFAIGSAILPGIGSIVGSVIGSLFCHIAGTLVRMDDGTLKAIEKIKLRDRVFLGGEVIGCGEVRVTNLFRYRGTVVNGQHAVLEDGRWLRVKDSTIAVRVDVPQCAIAYPIATEHHLMVLETHIAADVAEADEDTGAIGRLAQINANLKRNSRLAEVECYLGEKLSVDDLAKLQAYVLEAESERCPAHERNNNIVPKNVIAEMAAAAKIAPPSSRGQQVH